MVRDGGVELKREGITFCCGRGENRNALAFMVPKSDKAQRLANAEMPTRTTTPTLGKPNIEGEEEPPQGLRGRHTLKMERSR